MARDLQDAGRTFFVARDGGRAIGFAVMKANNPNKTKADADKEAAEGKVVGETPPEILRPHGIEVQRIYTDPAYHGTGAARALMEHTLQQARARGFRYAWLGAWERNSRALAFYSKFGFSSVGAQGVWVGEDLHRDEIMVREL
jgi:ribosomal protein S18 acetylase RimI-like enzyme